MASGLDVIAHEWGHGVINTSANFPCIFANTLPCQLHEGWADVIGNTVEKLRQPAGSGVEQSSDWTMHEDNGLSGYHRGALDDGDTGHTWTRLDGASIVVNQMVHRQDDPTNQQSHLRGNMLTMVLRLATEGGQNPICTRHPEFDGCSGTVVALGLTKATQILFDTLQYYTPSTARFEDLATYASQAAFDRYSDCYAYKPYMAIPEQSSISAAFTSIGYPRLTGPYTCQ
jgi:Zn-dependent metalloprotease